jgi:translation initiation factor 5B
MVLSGITQKYMEKGLHVKPGEGKGAVLEVKEFRGLGTTIDVILYDGELRRGDWIVIGGEKTVKTKVKALLEPEPLKELRIEKSFKQLDSVSAAAGVKIAASGLEEVVAGSPLRAVRNEKDVEKAAEEVREEVEEVEIETENEGALLKADTLGSLEALIKSLKERGIPIRKAVVGDLAKSDIMEMRALPEPVIFAFNVKVSQDVLKLAEDNRIKVFRSDIIYRLIEDHGGWKREQRKLSEEEILEIVTRPGKIKVLPGYVFRQKNPAVFGVEVLKGIIKPRYRLKKGDKVVGEIKEIQVEGENVPEVKAGEKAAVSMQNVTVGKDELLEEMEK